MSQENLTLIRDAFGAFDRGDVEWLVAHANPEVAISQPKDLPGAREYHGLDGMREAVADWPSEWEELRIEVTELIALGDDRVLAITRQMGRGRGSGIEVEAEFAFLLTIDAGLLTRWEMFMSREDALEAAGTLDEGEALSDG